MKVIASSTNYAEAVACGCVDSQRLARIYLIPSRYVAYSTQDLSLSRMLHQEPTCVDCVLNRAKLLLSRKT